MERRQQIKERLRLKIIERLLKEGSNADEPLNIPLSDYSSDEGGVSSSENECRGSSFSDLEGPCCTLSRAPPSTPEAEAQTRRHKLSRMRRVMHELDRIYFQPLFQKKFRCFMRYKPGKPKRANKKSSKKKSISSVQDGAKSQTRRLRGGVINGDGMSTQESLYEEIFQDALDGLSHASVSDSVNPSEDCVFLSAEGGTDDSRQDCRKVSRKFHATKKRSKETKAIKEPPQQQRLVVSRKLRMWLADRKIFIYRSKIKHRKLRARRSHSHRKRSETRIALDLPTTDPSADLIFSTDEEPNAPDEDDCLPQYCTVPRVRARRLLQSELQRRYIEEIGDNATGRSRAKMPPELIITSPSKGTKVTVIPKMTSSQRVTDAFGTLEFPVTFKPARRTNSWHNLNNGAPKPVCMARQNYRMPSSYTLGESKIEELDLKLSLKKRYWTGVKSDKSKEEHQRPLSWNQQILRQHTSGQQSRHGAFERLKKPSREKLEDTSHRKADNEAFLNACSQKLLHWQQELNNVGRTFVAKDANASPMLSRKISIQMGALALGMPEIIEDERTMRIFRKVSQVKKELKAPTKDEAGIVDHKLKRRSNALTKIADTSQLIARLTKGRSKSRGHGHATAKRTNNTNSHQQAGLSSNASKARIPGVNRFKTGSIVVTAVQQSSTKKVKKVHRSSKSQLSLSCVADGTCKKDQNNGAGGSTKLSKTNLSIKSSLNSNTFVRKVKTKLTKKKSSHTREETTNIAPSSRALVNNNSIITNNSIYGVPLSRKM